MNNIPIQTDLFDPINDIENIENIEDIKILRTVVYDLWAILDDIEDISDVSKEDTRLYKQLVEQVQNERWNIGIISAGESLFYET